MMPDPTPRLPSKDDPHRDHPGTGTDQHLGHETHFTPAKPGQDPGGHKGHNWMMIACCVPMLIIVIALVASGTLGAGALLLALGCTLLMVLMMVGMNGHDHGAGGKK